MSKRTIMNRLKKPILYLSLALACLSACTANHRQGDPNGGRVKSLEEAEAEFLPTLTAADSTTVKSMAIRCMDLLKADSMDKALDMLYIVRGTKLQKLTEEDKTRLQKRFEIFPVLEYEFEGMSFSTQGNNDVKFKTKFLEKSESNTPTSIGMMFNPVKIGDQWYLTMKNIGQKSQDVSRPLRKNSVAPAEITLQE